MHGCVSKIALFGKALVLALARGALPMCAMWVGFPFSFLRVGEKNKINSIKFALSYQKAKSFLFSIYHYRICLLVCLFTLVANVPGIATVADLRATNLSNAAKAHAEQRTLNYHQAPLLLAIPCCAA